MAFSGRLVEEAQQGKSDLLFRDSSVLQSFTTPKGSGTIFVLFEEIPFWLSAISPFACGKLIFPQFHTEEDLRKVSPEAEIFWRTCSVHWPRDRINFITAHVPNPNLILISGSQSFLQNPSFLIYQAPTIFTNEFRLKTRLSNPDFKFNQCKHSLIGGCTNFRISFGYRNISELPNIRQMKRSLGDFIDYSTYPTTPVKLNSLEPSKYLHKESIASAKTLSFPVVMSMCKFSSGWGSRELCRKECFNIWGLSDLALTTLELEWLYAVTPTQPANLLLASLFNALAKTNSRREPLTSPSKSTTIDQFTYFPFINVSIEHDWIDDTIVISPTRKADNAPVPASL